MLTLVVYTENYEALFCVYRVGQDALERAKQVHSSYPTLPMVLFEQRPGCGDYLPTVQELVCALILQGAADIIRQGPRLSKYDNIGDAIRWHLRYNAACRTFEQYAFYRRVMGG
jgi:hypothetical protein